MNVIAFIDGFNLYHAIHDCGRNHWKWLNLRSLCSIFAPEPQYNLNRIYYFSAYATWRPNAYKRHREYVKALEAVGVTPIMGNFKAKSRTCFTCNSTWVDHEEKETDVNLAIYLLKESYQDNFGRALILTGDSDLTPVIKKVKILFPNKELKIISPLNRNTSMDLFNAVGGSKNCKHIKQIHIERSLLPREVCNEQGLIIAVRPTEYDPP